MKDNPLSCRGKMYFLVGEGSLKYGVIFDRFIAVLMRSFWAVCVSSKINNPVIYS